MIPEKGKCTECKIRSDVSRFFLRDNESCTEIVFVFVFRERAREASLVSLGIYLSLFFFFSLLLV
jgi:hypothetical protein